MSSRRLVLIGVLCATAISVSVSAVSDAVDSITTKLPEYVIPTVTMGDGADYAYIMVPDTQPSSQSAAEDGG